MQYLKRLPLVIIYKNKAVVYLAGVKGHFPRGQLLEKSQQFQGSGRIVRELCLLESGRLFFRSL
jgi:hypothetical protein